MYLSDQYLEDLGIDKLPEDIKEKVVSDLEQSVQEAISVRLATQLTNELMDEFTVLSEGSIDDVKGWLVRTSPYYESSPAFLQGKEANEANEAEFTRQYAVVKWMEMNVPNYNEIVLEVLANTKGELLALQEKFLKE